MGRVLKKNQLEYNKIMEKDTTSFTLEDMNKEVSEFNKDELTSVLVKINNSINSFDADPIKIPGFKLYREEINLKLKLMDLQGKPEQIAQYQQNFKRLKEVQALSQLNLAGIYLNQKIEAEEHVGLLSDDLFSEANQIVEGLSKDMKAVVALMAPYEK